MQNLMTSRGEKRAKFLSEVVHDVSIHRRFMKLSPLFDCQIETIRVLEGAIRRREGEIFIVRSARQTMKNEVSAMTQLRTLLRYRRRGGSYVRSAPTYLPQIVNSKRRLTRFLEADPILRTRHRWTEGRIVQVMNASVQFLSADDKANVIGATASLCLDMDEAHKVNFETYEEKFVPMTAFTNAPRFLFGVGGEEGNLIHRYLPSVPADHYLCFPAPLWCELNPSYAKHYRERVALLGIDHPIIRTQYHIEDLAAIGGFLSPVQIDSLLSGDHERVTDFSGKPVYVVIDIGGEDRLERDDTEVRMAKPEQDSTAGIAFTVDWTGFDKQGDFPSIAIVDLFWRTGPSLPDLQEDLEAWLEKIKARGGRIDARGLGNQIASYFERRSHHRTEGYMATAPSVSGDCYDLLARLNHNSIKMFADDGSPEYGEFRRQLQYTHYEMYAGDRIRIVKPTHRAAGTNHIDFTKALTYIRQVRAAARKPLRTGPKPKGL